MTKQMLQIPEDLGGFVATLSVVADQDEVLAALLGVIAQAERFVAAVRRGEATAEQGTLLLWDITDTQRLTETVRERTRKLTARVRQVVG